MRSTALDFGWHPGLTQTSKLRTLNKGPCCGKSATEAFAEQFRGIRTPIATIIEISRLISNSDREEPGPFHYVEAFIPRLQDIYEIYHQDVVPMVRAQSNLDEHQPTNINAAT